MAEKKSSGDMTVREAGRKGGEKVASERGHEFYEEIGKKGGNKVASERGHEFYEEIGKKGGEKVASERGHQFYEEIGHKGGQKVKELIARGKGMAPRTAPPEEKPSGGEFKGGALHEAERGEVRKRSPLDTELLEEEAEEAEEED